MSALAEAIAVLHGGGLVVIPTDTVYGLAGRADMQEAVAAIFAVKSRPQDRPLPVLGASAEDLRSVAAFSEEALSLARAFWPGPLTLVLPRARRFSFDLGGSDPSTIGVRVPAHPVALELLGETGPLAVTSANVSGEPPAATVADARRALGDAVEVYLDGGAVGGAPSTVARLTDGVEILRAGAIDQDRLRATLAGQKLSS